MIVVKSGYEGRKTASVLSDYTNMIKAACSKVINDRILSKLDNLRQEADSEQKQVLESAAKVIDGVITTEEEYLGHRITQAICAGIVSVDRLILNDTMNYCAVLLDNSKRTVIRMYFNGKKKHIVYFDAERKEVKFPIEDVADIYKAQEQIRAVVKRYLDAEKKKGE